MPKVTEKPYWELRKLALLQGLRLKGEMLSVQGLATGLVLPWPCTDAERCDPAPWWTLLELPSVAPQDRACVPHLSGTASREEPLAGVDAQALGHSFPQSAKRRRGAGTLDHSKASRMGLGPEASTGQGCLIPMAWSAWWPSAVTFKLPLWAPAVTLKGS